MPGLYFKVEADYQKVIKLREEIVKLKSELSGMDGNTSPAILRGMEAQLAKNTKELDTMLLSAAKAGTEINQNFKKNIFNASQAVNGLTEKITFQRGTIQQLKNELSGLKEKYREALKQDGDTSSLEAKIKSTSGKLREQKEVLFNLTQKQANARLSVKKLRDEYELYNNDGKKVVATNEGMAISWKKALAVIGGVSALKALGSEIIRVRGEFQSMQTAIETMVGKDMAGILIPQIKELAKISPLTMSDMVGAEKMMLGFNIQAEDTIKYLKAISDISMGDSGKFNSLTLAFSQMSAAGKLMGQDLNQMINSGFNPLQIIAEKTGKSIAQLKDEMSKGAVSAEMVQQAFIDATSAGGKFFGMSENASKTINGQISMMQDALDNAFNEIGQKSEGAIMKGIQMTTSLIENYETVGKALVGLIGTYGAYRTAIMLLTAFESKHTLVEIGLTNVRILARKAQLALNASMLTNPYVLLAVAVGGLVAVVWTLHDSTTAAEKAQKQLNKEQEEAAQRKQELTSKTENLIAKINSETESIYAQIKAYNELVKLFPDLKGITFEEFKGMPQSQQKSMIDNIIDKKELEDAVKLYEADLKRIETLKKQISDAESSPYNKGDNIWIKDVKRLKELLELIQQLAEGHKTQIEEIKQNQWEANTPLEEKVKHYEKIKESLEEQRRALYEQIEPSTVLKTSVEDANKAWAQMPDIIGQIKLDTLNKKIDETSKKINSLTGKGDGSMLAVTKNKSHWEEQKKNAITALEAIDSKAKSLLDTGNKKGAKTFLIGDLKKTEKEADAIVKTYQDSVKKLNEANKNLKLYDFSEKKTDVLKSQQDLSRSILDADLKFQSERIAIMEDGRKKRLAQSELEHQQQKAAIEKEYQDTIQKYKDLKQAVPETVETTYKARLQANDEAKTIRDKRINEEMDKALMERQKEITSVFLSEEQKRLNAIKERYDKEREWAKKSFQSGSFSSKDDYEAYLTTINDAEAEERKKSLLDKHQDYTDQRLAIEKKFNDDIATLQAERKNVEVKGQTDMVQQIDRAIAQATRDKAQSLVSLDFEQLKKRPEYIRAFENLKQTSSETLDSLLTQLENAKQTAAEVLSPDQLREYTSTIESIMDELTERNPFQALAERKKELAEAEEELANAKRNLDYVNGGGKIVTSMNYDKNTGKTEQSYLSSTQALENYNKAKDKAVKANARVIDAEKKASNVIRKLGDSLQDVGDSMGGLGGEIISIIGSITSTVMAGIEGMQNASEIGAAAIRTIEKASVILAIISAALQIANKIASLFKQTDYMAEFRKEMEELNYELELTRLNAEISTDENSIFGDDLWRNAIKNVLLANEVFMKYNDTLKEISDRKKYTGLMGIITENKGLKNSYDSLADSLANMQIQIRHSTWFRSAKYSSLKDAAPELFNADGTVNMDALKGFLGTDTFKKLSEENQKYLQEMSDYWETYQEAVDQVKGYLTNIFGELGNTMSDALVDAFENGTDAAQAFTDSVVDMLETLAKQMIYSITLTPVIENAQQKMLDVTKNEQLNEEQKFNNYISILDELTDGVLSEQERYNKFLEKYQEMAAQKGFDIFTPDEEETERTATAKSGIAASQDSVNELNGNFNAMLIYSEKTCEGVAQVREHLAYIWEIQKEGWQNVKVIRELTEKVEEHTSKIVELTEKIEKNTGDTAGGIEEMNIKGVYLKK